MVMDIFDSLFVKNLDFFIRLLIFIGFSIYPSIVYFKTFKLYRFYKEFLPRTVVPVHPAIQATDFNPYDWVLRNPA